MVVTAVSGGGDRGQTVAVSWVSAAGEVLRADLPANVLEPTPTSAGPLGVVGVDQP
jgi:hypothetical protein